MKNKLKIIFAILILFTSINLTYAENKCEIKDFQFNDIFEKNPELDYYNTIYKIIDSKFGGKRFKPNESRSESRSKEKEPYYYYLDQTLIYIDKCDFDKAFESFKISQNYINTTYKNYDSNVRSYVKINDDFLGIYINFLNGNFNESIKTAKTNYGTIGFELNMGLIDNGDIQEYKKMYSELTFWENYITKIKNLKSFDEYSGEQYYLDKLNIIEAWKNKNFGCVEYLSNGQCKTKFSGKKDIVVAVIDDGINLNHLDITNKIWTNQKEIPGNKIDDDKNGYIDDFNGWNFEYNDNNTLPMGEHGTAVAGVIGAEKDNGIGMAGIIPNAKIMSLGVFSQSGTTETEKILNAVDYAINNGADIINLSLAGNQFVFTQEYNDIFLKAYNKNIPIIVSAGNGDTLSSGENGVNTTINKLSPVCNDYGNKKIVFGVGSFQENGEKSKWSNYGDCVDFWTYGENIFSLSLLDEESEYGKEYNKFYGTSFSAPILSGIIGLGINKVGNVKIDLIYEVLEKSLKGNIINTNLFIDNLISLSNEEVKKQEEIKRQESMKKLQEKINQKNEERKKKFEEKKQQEIIEKERILNENNYNKIIDFLKNKWLEIIAILFIVLLGIGVFIRNRKNNF